MVWFKLSLVAFIGFVCALGSPAVAQDRFALLRTVSLDPASGRLVVDMRQVRSAVTELRFRTRPAPITFNRITIVFANNRRQVITRRFRTSGRDWTPTIVRWRAARRIRSIIFAFTRQRGRRTVLEIRGRTGAVATPPGPTTRRPPISRRYYRRRHDRRYSAGPRRAWRGAPRRSAEGTARPREGEESNQARAPVERPPPPAERPPRTSSERARPSVTPRPPARSERSSGATGGSRPEARPRTTERSGSEPNPDCVKSKVCTLVRIFFGTNRQRDERSETLLKRISFGSRRKESLTTEEELTLGRAIVTVPRAVQRATGEITRPGFLEGFWDRYLRGVTPEGDPSRHFVIVRGGFALYANPDDFVRAVAAHKATAGDDKDHAFVFVHGYNTKFDHALFRTAQIAYDLGGKSQVDGVFRPFGTPFMYSWPSAGGELFYPYDQESARFAVAHLKAFLDLIIRKTGVTKLHLIAHSMGNVPLLNALAQIAASPPPGGTRINQVILAAPDMDAAEFRKLATRINPIAKGITMYSSSSDAAMDISRALHNNFPRAGDVVTGQPVVAGGVHTIDISKITTCYFCTGHSEYVEQPTLLSDISSLLHAGLRLPHQRNATLRLEPPGGGANEYWRYEPN